MSERTPTHIMVNVIDFDSLEAAATDQLNRQAERFGIKLEEGETVKANIAHTWGFVETEHGMYVLCNEGVGPDDPLQEFEFEVHYEILNPNSTAKTFSMFPVSSVKQTPEQLRARATGERVELSEFIRTFGARLDQNFAVWRRVLEPIVKDVLA